MSRTIPSTDPYLGIIAEKRFRPFYTPNDMLYLGVYGGAAFGSKQWRKVGDFPEDLVKGVDVSKYSNITPDPAKNYFGTAGTLSDRTFSMPPMYKSLHHNWFEWYCLYYYGNRSAADGYRIDQWLKAINQHWFYILKGPYTGGGEPETDLTYLADRRQKLLEMGVDPTVTPEDYSCYYQF